MRVRLPGGGCLISSGVTTNNDLPCPSSTTGQFHAIPLIFCSISHPERNSYGQQGLHKPDTPTTGVHGGAIPGPT